MRETETYVFTCECGGEVTSETREGVCPHCNREFRLIWPGVSSRPKVAKTITDKYERTDEGTQPG
jgi:hypothetical protein